MSKKHYKLIAQVIASIDIPMKYKEKLVYELIPILKNDNRNFSAEKFIEACLKEKENV